MSTRAASARASSSSGVPYSKRAVGQPKSSRQQFSACGACRMRRVKCDLKDLITSATAGSEPITACSNCQERGLKCVDEFAEVKAVKILRRGRRIQQVEAVYGRHRNDASSASPKAVSPSSIPDFPHSAPSIIPTLRSDFLTSEFFHRFCVQRPILDAVEFSLRFFSFTEGNASALTPEARLCASLLVVWAASYGVDEYGVEQDDNHGQSRKDRKDKTNLMVEEVLRLVDLYGILRKPTWDGVRALLLLLPLTDEVQPPLGRLTMYETTLSQVYSLCSLASPSSAHSGQGPHGDALVRARIFWYAHVHEGITTGLRGGRLILDDEDLAAFQATLPPVVSQPSSSSSSSSSSTSPVSPTVSSFSSLSPPPHELGENAMHTVQASAKFLTASRLFSAPLHLASVCRQVHSALTGPKARRRVEVSDEVMVDIWEGLAQSWEEFENIRRTGAGGVGFNISDTMTPEDADKFVSGWQVFIFECHNVIRVALKQRVESYSPVTHPHVSSASFSKLYAHASQKCYELLPHVVTILRHHLSAPAPGFFSFDAAIVRDGCFFAAYLLAEGDFSNKPLECIGEAEEGVQLCLRALGEMRWVFSKSEERAETLRGVWEEARARDSTRFDSERRGQNPPRLSSIEAGAPYPQQNPCLPQPPDPRITPSQLPTTSSPQSLFLLPYISDPPYDDGSNASASRSEDGPWQEYTPRTSNSPSGHSPSSQHSSSPVVLHYLPSTPFKDVNGYYPDVNPFNGYSTASSSTMLPPISVPPSLDHSYPSQVHAQMAQDYQHEYVDPAAVLSTAPTDRNALFR